MKVTCYIPTFNSATTIAQVIASVRNQTHPVNELLVIDDCSSDATTSLAEQSGANVIRQAENQGRGACRAKAFEVARNELVLACDSTVILAPELLQRCVELIESTQAAFVCARVVQPPAKTVVERWRGRHLYKESLSDAANQLSGGFRQGVALGRRSVVMELGNYSSTLRYWEDAELASRLDAAGYKVIFDPSLPPSVSLHRDSIWQVFERLWRWNSHDLSDVTVGSYLRQIAYWWKYCASKDILDGDFCSLPITLFYPHYWLIKSALYLDQCKRSSNAVLPPPNSKSKNSEKPV